MNIRDKWDVYLLPDVGERLRRFHVRHGAADYLAARLFDLTDLAHGSSDIARVRLSHRLHANGSITADFHITYIDGLSYASLLQLPSSKPLRNYTVPAYETHDVKVADNHNQPYENNESYEVRHAFFSGRDGFAAPQELYNDEH